MRALSAKGREGEVAVWDDGQTISGSEDLRVDANGRLQVKNRAVVTEAPQDGKLYGRRNANWAEVRAVAGGGGGGDGQGGGEPGPPGPPGPEGPVGPPGSVGPTGPAGRDGAVGPQGPAGAMGPQGPQGVAGADSTVPGPQGPAGATGAQGSQGVQGIQGPQGPAGVAGSPGPKGDPQTPSDANPLVNGTAAPGTSALYSRGDHIHPTDTTRAALTQVVRYDAAQALTAPQQAIARANIAALGSADAPIRGFLAGLTLSTAGSSATFGIAAGSAADSTSAVVMALTSAYTKTTAAWAVGSNNGALDVGTVTANTWYHVYLIMRSDTGVVDVCFSTQPVAPNFGVNVPVAYNRYRRIGALRANASLQWIKFIQIGDKFLWDPIISDAASVAFGASVTLIVLTVPPGLTVTAQFYGYMTSSSPNVYITFASPLITLAGANSPAGNISLMNSTAGSSAAGQFSIETNTTAQIQLSGAAVGGGIYISTQGWTDRRGRDV